MLRRLLYALPLAVLGVFATTGTANAAFDPTRDELMIGTFLIAAGLMLLLSVFYAVKWFFGLDRQPDVYFPDHAHDPRYADHH